MTRMPFAGAIDLSLARNSAIAAAYREAARRLLSRSVSTLANAMADQRRESARELEALRLALHPAAELELDCADPEAVQASIAPPRSEDAVALLTAARSWESADFELLAAISGATLPASTEVAERFAALADQARKRSLWAQDHLDLLGISG